MSFLTIRQNLYKNFLSSIVLNRMQCSPFVHTIACANASRCNTSLMHVKNSRCHFCLWKFVWHIGTKKMKQRAKTSNLIADHFSLIFANLSLVWMLCHNQFGWHQPPCLSLSKSQQSNLSNPEAHSEPCQTWKVECC